MDRRTAALKEFYKKLAGTRENTSGIEIRLKSVVDMCLESIRTGDIDGEEAGEFYDEINSLFNQLVKEKSDPSQFEEIFESASGSEGIIYSDAGQEICNLFFGSCDNYQALRDKLLDIFESRNNLNKEARIKWFYKKLSKDVGFKKQAAEIGSPEYYADFDNFTDMVEKKYFVLNHKGANYESFVYAFNAWEGLGDIRNGSKFIEDNKDTLQYLFTVEGLHETEQWYRDKTNSNIYIKDNANGMVHALTPKSDDELYDLMMDACRI